MFYSCLFRLHQQVCADKIIVMQLKASSLNYHRYILTALFFTWLVQGADGVIIVTNCPEVLPSLSQAKSIQNSCPSFAALGRFNVRTQLSTNGFYCGFGSSAADYAGLARANSNGGFLWKIACTNGGCFPTTTAGQFWALQDLQSGPVTTTCFGVYNRSSGSIVPLFEKQLPFSNYQKASLAVLNNGYFVLSLDRSNSVSLLAWNSTGTLLWSKTLSSTDFPDATLAGASRKIDVTQMGTNTILLSIAAKESTGLTSVLVCLDSSGTVQWSKKVIMVSGPSGGSSYSASVTPNADVLVVALDIDAVTFTVSTVIAKITSTGVLSWGQKIVGAGYQGFRLPVDSQGTVLLNLSSGQECVCCVIAAAGQVKSLVGVDVTSPTISGLVMAQAVSIPAEKIYYAVSGAPHNGIIGSSSLSFSNFVGKSADTSQFSFELLAHLDDNRVALAGVGTNGTAFQLVTMNSDLIEESGCSIFNSPATFATSIPSAYAVTNTPTLLSISVQSSNTPVVLNSTQLQFETITFDESPLCFASPPPLPALGMARSSSNLVLSWPTSALDFTLSSATNMPATTWISNTTQPAIVSGKYVITNTVSGKARYFRLIHP